ncbi:MAG: hypothetical protein NC350_03880 [Corallococcus sp.]|nr:hypothetical protein [Corallococcus sp.]
MKAKRNIGHVNATDALQRIDVKLNGRKFHKQRSCKENLARKVYHGQDVVSRGLRH